MGYIAHDAVIVVVAGYVMRGEKPLRTNIAMPDVEAFRVQMPETLRHLLVGPIPSAVNDDFTYFFAPDGSKEGWDLSDLGDVWRAKFVALFQERYDDDSGPFDILSIRFGGDEGREVGSRITYDSDRQAVRF